MRGIAAFSPDGTRIVTSFAEDMAHIWDVATGTEIARLDEHEGTVCAAVFSPDGTRVVTASGDRTARIWDAESGAEIACIKGHARALSGAAFRPDGTRIVTASEDDTARIWSAASGKRIAHLKGHLGTVLGAAFSPDGTRVVTASDDKTARIWDAATGAEIACLKGNGSTVCSAAFSPDGEFIITASDDDIARVWDAGSGAEIFSIEGQEDAVWVTAFSRAGTDEGGGDDEDEENEDEDDEDEDEDAEWTDYTLWDAKVVYEDEAFGRDSEKAAANAENYAGAFQQTFAAEADANELNFSMESLRYVDRLIEETWEGGSPSEEGMQNCILCFGGYVGKTLEKEIEGFWWHDGSESVYVKSSSGTQVLAFHPYSWAAQRLHEGQEASLYDKFRLMKKMAETF